MSFVPAAVIASLILINRISDKIFSVSQSFFGFFANFDPHSSKQTSVKEAYRDSFHLAFREIPVAHARRLMGKEWLLLPYEGEPIHNIRVRTLSRTFRLACMQRREMRRYEVYEPERQYPVMIVSDDEIVINPSDRENGYEIKVWSDYKMYRVEGKRYYVFGGEHYSEGCAYANMATLLSVGSSFLPSIEVVGGSAYYIFISPDGDDGLLILMVSPDAMVSATMTNPVRRVQAKPTELFYQARVVTVGGASGRGTAFCPQLRVFSRNDGKLGFIILTEPAECSTGFDEPRPVPEKAFIAEER